jgi:hypothetical protein
MKYVALLLMLAALALPARSQEPTSITVAMHALNGSGENGTATITQGANGLLVSIALENGLATAQPTHIHIGTCDTIHRAPEYSLRDTVNGQGKSVIAGVTLSELLTHHYAINVHKSALDLDTYASCGDIH